MGSTTSSELAPISNELLANATEATTAILHSNLHDLNYAKTDDGYPYYPYDCRDEVGRGDCYRLNELIDFVLKGVALDYLEEINLSLLTDDAFEKLVNEENTLNPKRQNAAVFWSQNINPIFNQEYVNHDICNDKSPEKNDQDCSRCCFNHNYRGFYLWYGERSNIDAVRRDQCSCITAPMVAMDAVDVHMPERAEKYGVGYQLDVNKTCNNETDGFREVAIKYWELERVWKKTGPEDLFTLSMDIDHKDDLYHFIPRDPVKECQWKCRTHSLCEIYFVSANLKDYSEQKIKNFCLGSTLKNLNDWNLGDADHENLHNYVPLDGATWPTKSLFGYPCIGGSRQ